MCGIFGVSSVVGEGGSINLASFLELFVFLAKKSQRRGQESSGFALRIKGEGGFEIHGFKAPFKITDLLKTEEFVQVKKFLQGYSGPVDLMGHARLVTNGNQHENDNNQPIFDDNCAVIHNGIITNIAEIDENHVFKSYGIGEEVDTKYIHRLFSDPSLENSRVAWLRLISEIKGTASIATFSTRWDEIALASNNGSLYMSKGPGVLVFGSEEVFLEELMENFGGKVALGEIEKPSFYIHSNTNDASVLSEKGKKKYFDTGLSIIERTFPMPISISKRADESLLEDNRSKVKSIKRCTKCILPSTFPYIGFDSKGVCNYCNNYKKIYSGNESVTEFQNIAEKFKKKHRGNRYDCLVPFSGGRDSSYGLHLIVKELGLRPVTFTYDWGMVTDLARRNIARMCGELGVENIIVSANLKKKRENIRKNVLAWLKRPHLGLIPLFMAGDKYFFYYNNLLRKELGVEFDIWMTNKLENTDFKVGYCDIPPDFEKKRIDALSLANTAKMPIFYLKQYFLNPRFWNSSIFDTIGSFYSYYIQPRDGYYRIFDYFHWNELTVNKTLTGSYGWETSPDFKSTWRIGDGTAAFYNYVYFTVGGFTEIDTFRSNQIREGMLSREEALELANEENTPRFTAIQWYLDILGIDFNMAIREINKLPKLYDSPPLVSAKLSEV